MNYTQAMQAIKQIEQSNSASFWLKEALQKALNRDLVDAYYDALTITEILKAKLEHLQGRKD